MKTKADKKPDDMQPEYDFAAMKGGVRSKHLDAYQKGSNLVLLDPDVAAVFRDPAAVNDALRSLIDTTGSASLKPAPKRRKSRPAIP
jgi:hypothetical protein